MEAPIKIRDIEQESPGVVSCYWDGPSLFSMTEDERIAVLSIAVRRVRAVLAARARIDPEGGSDVPR